MNNCDFYTVLIGDKFINSNFIKEPTYDIYEAIKFKCSKDAEEYCELIKEGVDFKITGVKCIYKRKGD